ncbi:unnamed protein product [Rhizophagus irregularis]|nr:unnamed protein product [Rhizophagus irregularis]
MTIDNEQVWVSGGLGITIADLPQGNDLAGTLGHNATHGCLTTNLLKREVLTNMKERMNLQSYRHVINKIIKCWVQFSLTTHMVFSKTLTKVDYETIQKMLELECKMLLEQDIRFEHIIGQGIQNIVNDVALRPLLNSWYIISSLLPKIYDEDDIETNIITCIPEIMDINVRLKWNKYQRNQENFTIGKHLNGYLSNELANAYTEYYNDRGAMINSKVEFYNNISYVVKEDDCFVDVQLNVGDIVDVFEEDFKPFYDIIKALHDILKKLLCPVKPEKAVGKSTKIIG